MTSAPSPDRQVALALKELTRAIQAFGQAAANDSQGLRSELVRIEEAIRDTAPLGHQRLS